MANRRSSIKKIRIDKRRRVNNLRVLSELKTFTRRVNGLIAEKKAAEAATASRELFSKIDKAVKKGIMHRNRAAHRKSSLSLRLNSLKSAK